jgi:hypothetical protein
VPANMDEPDPALGNQPPGKSRGRSEQFGRFLNTQQPVHWPVSFPVAEAANPCAEVPKTSAAPLTLSSRSMPSPLLSRRWLGSPAVGACNP